MVLFYFVSLHTWNYTIIFLLQVNNGWNSNLMKVKKILVSQPRPKLENSPFFDLQKKRKVKKI